MFVSPEHEVVGVDVRAVLGLPQVAGVADDGAAPAGGGAALLQRVPVPGDDPKQLCQGGVQAPRGFLPLQLLSGRKITLGYDTGSFSVR